MREFGLRQAQRGLILRVERERGLAVREVGHALVGERLSAAVKRGLETREARRIDDAGRGERGGLLGPDRRVDRQVGAGARPVAGRTVHLREGVGLQVETAEVVGVPEGVVGREGVVGTDVGAVAHRAGTHVLRHVAEFGYRSLHVGGEGGLAREQVARARPFDDAGEVADAGVGEG